jgi:ribosomal protein S18 acetylase RimI-like enzyme
MLEPKMPLPSSSVKIIQAVEVTEELFQSCKRLIPQLTSINPPPTRAELTLMLTGGTSVLFMAQDQESGGTRIIGLATVVIYRVPTGIRAIIEDVVVEKNARGRGIGEALTRACLERAEQYGCSQVMLTSNPGREAANRLYQRMDFEPRKTNAYCYRFKRG